MARTFLPKAHYMPWCGGYMALYKFYLESPWTIVPGRKLFATQREAVAAADAYMVEKLNKANHHEMMEPVVENPLDAEVKDFLARREQYVAEEKSRVFGDKPAAIIFRKGRQVKVEHKKKRRRV